MNTIAETANFIILDRYDKHIRTDNTHQSEDGLERELIVDLQSLGYEYVAGLNSTDKMLKNVREQLQRLNDVVFSDDEWQRFVSQYLDHPSDGVVDKTRKIQDNHKHDFVFDDGHIENIYLLDKVDLIRNKLQVIHQFEQTGSHANRYDVTLLVNGLPLVQIELKRRGVDIREAFNQVHRYSKESFNSDNSLYKYLQLFVISNGTDTRYFANTTKRDKNSFNFTMHWATLKNESIEDLKDFTPTFFERRTLLSVLLKYAVFDASDTLLVMRPYQIAATERILWKIKSSFQSKTWSKPEAGGYIWHTTGSGKTLTSFKAARLATELGFIDKVFFVVDRKDLDYQTMKEYQRFSEDSVNGSDSTKGLMKNIENNDNKIIVTTIQKLNNLMRGDSTLPIYDKQVVFIFDEAHRSQFGEAQRNLKKKFKTYYQFGFTGTPIFAENTMDGQTTAGVFGHELHAYVVTDAIGDGKVLKFKVDYNDVRPQFHSLENESDEEKISRADYKKMMRHSNRIREVAQYILDNFTQKTRRRWGAQGGFNAMFAVDSVDSAKAYYEAFKELQIEPQNQSANRKPLKVATIFSFAANEEQGAKGNIADESFELSALNSTAKEFLGGVIDDYNQTFKTNFGVDSKGFQDYYRELAKKVQTQEVDLLIVVGMFLTGFDAPQLNTLFVDKNLSYHGLIQAFSRTNRIYNANKPFGNIVCFRNLEQATIDALKLFGKSSTREMILEKSYQEYMQGFEDIVAGKSHRGYIAVVEELNERFPQGVSIESEQDKKDFARLFGEYLRAENVLLNYDEFDHLKAFQAIDKDDPEAIEAFKAKYFLSDEDITGMQGITVIPERMVQDYRSHYHDIRQEWIQNRENKGQEDSGHDWDGIVFEVDLLKSQEINLDYILGLLYESGQQAGKTKDELIEDARRLLRSSVDNRAKEELIVDFIRGADLDQMPDKADLIAAFYTFAQKRLKKAVEDIISTEGLKEDAAIRYIKLSLKQEHASDIGTGLSDALPKMSPLNPKYKTRKQRVFEKMVSLVERFKGVGGYGGEYDA